MRLVVFVLVLAFLGPFPGLADPKPSPSSSPASVDRKASKEVAEMEKRLTLASDAGDTAALEKMIADTYFDTYEGGEVAKSKSGAIARCKAGLQSFLKIEKPEKFSGTRDSVTVEGEAKLAPDRVDDVSPDNQWVHVRRLWTRKDGAWQLTSQVRRLIE